MNRVNEGVGRLDKSQKARSLGKIILVVHYALYKFNCESCSGENIFSDCGLHSRALHVKSLKPYLNGV